ncbi:hypothetical protein ATE84_4906 [Aquimarina sp. MAR_2010_214]|uniref:hypothetical protein n=1 Tax=Aquimarina sp. MAR_2010_214 TaxID=1250026 RepID=UPI000C711692|nr:hypothetical protein [Aquimarina sp. MAR_2010_214]PKV52779.1 hypothetical protein ATE84_4906 [Aquimarina sp. MAR_2010_214]
MRTHLIIIIVLILNLHSFAQTNKKNDNGKFYTIKGLITDKNSKDTLHLVIVEFMNKENKLIKAMRSDFDGIYYSSICSKELIDDSLLIKTTNAFYKQEVFNYKIVSDTIININMDSDSNKTFSKEKFEEYNRLRMYGRGCGLVDDDEYDELEYQRNLKTYKHYCTGQIKKYRSLIDDNAIFSEWILIEK